MSAEELCDGGDSCCVNGICGVGEGDCDNDSDCQPGNSTQKFLWSQKKEFIL